MVRALRPQIENALYYITVRGNNSQPLFNDHFDQRHYIDLLNRYRERFGCCLYAYILLTNHLHLLLETPKANIGKFMQCLGTSYVSYFNRRYKRRGTLFEGRYESHLVPKDQLLEFNTQFHSCKLMPASMDEDGLRRSPSLPGGSSSLNYSYEAGEDLKNAENIIKKISLSMGLNRSEDLRGKRRRALPRHLAMYLIRRQTLLPLRLIGTLLGVKPAAVAIAIGKVEKRLKDGEFPGYVETLLKQFGSTGVNN